MSPIVLIGLLLIYHLSYSYWLRFIAYPCMHYYIYIYGFLPPLSKERWLSATNQNGWHLGSKMTWIRQRTATGQAPVLAVLGIRITWIKSKGIDENTLLPGIKTWELANKLTERLRCQAPVFTRRVCRHAFIYEVPWCASQKQSAVPSCPRKFKNALQPKLFSSC